MDDAETTEAPALAPYLLSEGDLSLAVTKNSSGDSASRRPPASAKISMPPARRNNSEPVAPGKDFLPSAAGRKRVQIMRAKGITTLRSNAGGATRGKARAAQVQAMNAKKREKSSTATERGAARNRREVFASLAENKAAGIGVVRPSASSPARRSAGLNPFGVPASNILDAIINSKRKR